MSDANWYYLEDATPTGPFSWTRLLEISKAGIIRPSTLVRAEGTKDWVAFADAASQFPTTMPPLPGASTHQSATQSSAAHVIPPPAHATSSWSPSPPAPWRRYGARMLDTSIHGLAGFFLLGFVTFAFAPAEGDKLVAWLESPGGTLATIPLMFLMAAIIGGFVVGATGSSIGKAIFGIKVVDANAQVIGISSGLKREARVWCFGLGLGIPIVVLIAMVVGYRHLTQHGVTTWDEGQYVVVHRPNGPLQYSLNGVGILLLLMIFVASRALG